MIFMDLKIICYYHEDMYRKIERTLLQWKNESGRKPLLLTGARQTGKTFTMKEFGKNEFDSLIFVDFEKSPRARTIFDRDLEPESIIAQLEILTGQHYIENRTLIILDEIQACPKAITSLKYFYDSNKDYHIIGAGSLLGVALKRDDFSFPVGKVKEIRMYPLDFEEFLLAGGKEQLNKECRNAFLSCTHLPVFLHDELLSLYRDYLIVGGMPEAVVTYLARKSYIEAEDIQAQILSDYRSDIAKYAYNSDKLLAQRAFDTIPIQLAKENKKFQYNLIRKGATSAIFGKALEWLTAAGLTLRCRKIEIPALPIKAYEDLSSFKLYLLDTGLLMNMSGLPAESILNQIGERFIGALAENYVAASLTANDIPLFYWESSGQAEIDFIIQCGTAIIPIEVKASSHVRSRSLSVYRNRFNPVLSIRISTKNFGLEDGILSIPLYSTWLICPDSLHDILEKCCHLS